MRLVVWNSNNGINKDLQKAYLLSLKPDLAIIPELKEKNIKFLGASDSIWITNNHTNPSPKGLGILSFSEAKLELLPRDEEMEIYIPIKVHLSSINFNLLAVWNFYWAAKQGRFKDAHGENAVEWNALKHYESMLKSPCLIAGDFNFGPTFSRNAYIRLLETVRASGLDCLYQNYHKIHYDNLDNRTFKPARGNKLHILDHVFGSEFFCKSITNIKTDSLENAVLSDHAPIIVDFDI